MISIGGEGVYVEDVDGCWRSAGFVLDVQQTCGGWRFLVRLLLPERRSGELVTFGVGIGGHPKSPVKVVPAAEIEKRVRERAAKRSADGGGRDDG